MPADTPGLTLLFADEEALFLDAVVAALDRQADMAVVAHTGNGETALMQATQLRPDVAFLGAGLEALDGVQTCAAIKGAGLSTRVVVMSEAAERTVLFQAVLAGADGYITRGASLSEIIDAAWRVQADEAVIPPAMVAPLLRDLARRRTDEDSALRRFARLSRREREVLALVAEGLGHEEIAAELVVSPHTARTHIQNMLEKLEVHSRLEAATLAMKYGLVERFAETVPHVPRGVD